MNAPFVSCFRKETCRLSIRTNGVPKPPNTATINLTSLRILVTTFSRFDRVHRGTPKAAHSFLSSKDDHEFFHFRSSIITSSLCKVPEYDETIRSNLCPYTIL